MHQIQIISKNFPLEMQCNDRKDLSLRTRCYQGLQASYAYDDGFSQWLSQGAYEAKVEAARSAIAMGLTVEQIVKITGLSEEEISQLQQSWGAK